MSVIKSVTVNAYSNVAAVCPVAPPGAQAPVDEITGYIMWGVIVLFSISTVVLIGCAVGAFFFRMSHAVKGAVGAMAGVLVSAVGYLVGPGILDGILGSGCV